MDNFPAALSIPAAAKYLSISRANLYRLIGIGAIKPAKIGHRTLIRRVDADRFLENALTASVKPASSKVDLTQTAPSAGVFG